jgi:hypothetical protein
MAKRRSEPMTRAEKIRAQRQQSQKSSPTKPLGAQVTRKKSQNKVQVTRRQTTTIPKIDRNRRKVNVPLKNKGAELHLPALPRMRTGWRLFSGLVGLLSLAVVISFIGLDAFEVSTINLTGAERMTAEVILAHTDFLGKSIISLNPDEIETQVIENISGLKHATVSVGLPASINISVVERQPVVLWQRGESSLWIDSEGLTFPINGEATVEAVVIADADPPAALVSPDEEKDTDQEDQESIEEEPLSTLQEIVYPKTTPEFIQAVLTLTSYLPEGVDLQYKTQFGLGWHDPQGWMVYFGKDTDNLDIKLTEYQTIIERLKQENITPTLISLEFLYAPFYRME